MTEHMQRVHRAIKTEYEFEVQGDYGYGDGWEMVTAAATMWDADQYLNEYRQNEPGVSFRVKRVKVEQ